MLLGDGDAIGLAILADQHFDQVGNGAVVAQGRNARGFLDAGVDAQVQGGGLGREVSCEETGQCACRSKPP
jgi:hypothetical protein